LGKWRSPIQPGQKLKIFSLPGRRHIGLHVVVRWLPEIFNFKYLSTIHTRSALGKLTLAIDDILRNNEEEPMLTLLEDACGCVHCTLFAACDKYRYRELGAAGHDAARTI